MAVRFTVEGYKNEHLLLTWSLEGQDTPWTWQADTLAYRLIATTNKDDGALEVWVPDLIRPGEYKLNVAIYLTEGHELLKNDAFVIDDE